MEQNFQGFLCIFINVPQLLLVPVYIRQRISPQEQQFHLLVIGILKKNPPKQIPVSLSWLFLCYFCHRSSAICTLEPYLNVHILLCQSLSCIHSFLLAIYSLQSSAMITCNMFFLWSTTFLPLYWLMGGERRHQPRAAEQIDFQAFTFECELVKQGFDEPKHQHLK